MRKVILLCLLICTSFLNMVFAIRLDSVAVVRREAMSAYNAGKLDSAVLLYNKVVAMGDSSVFPFYNLACVYSRLGDEPKSRQMMQNALDRGYMDYLEMTMDADLRTLQSQPYWQQLYSQAYMNAVGKTSQKHFRNSIGSKILHHDAEALLQMSADSVNASTLNNTLTLVDSLCNFSGVNTSRSLMERSKLMKKVLTYEDNKYICREQYDFPFPVPLFDADLGHLIGDINAHLYVTTVDDAYSWMDSLTVDNLEQKISLSHIMPAITDSVMMLALQIKKQEAFHYEEKRSKSAVAEVNDVLSSAKQISKSDFLKKSLNKMGETYFIRLASLPLKRNDFKGMKIVFYKDADVAVLVENNYYTYITSSKLKKLAKKIDVLVKD